jgi:nitroreductase
MADNILKKAPHNSYTEALKPVSWDAFSNILDNRRSVRVYENTPVPDDVVKKCLSAALLAPNSSNLQQWEFYWIKSEEGKKTVAEICVSQPAATTAPVLIACVARIESWKKNRLQMLEYFAKMEAQGSHVPASAKAYYKKLVPFFYTQGLFSILGFIKSILFFFRGLKEPTPREPMNRAEMKIWAAKSTALACQNLMMAFSAAGYDSCPMEGYDSSRLRKFLKLECDAFPVMVISAGKRAANGVYGPRVRFPEEQFIKVV